MKEVKREEHFCKCWAVHDESSVLLWESRTRFRRGACWSARQFWVQGLKNKGEKVMKVDTWHHPLASFTHTVTHIPQTYRHCTQTFTTYTPTGTRKRTQWEHIQCVCMNKIRVTHTHITLYVKYYIVCSSLVYFIDF